MSPLAGRTALVTGAGVRVGRAIAIELGRAKMHVAVHYHSSREPAERTCAEIIEAGGRAFALQADLGDRAAARQLVDDSVKRLGQLDLLVPSAAIFERIPYETVDDTAWDRFIEMDLTSAFVLAQRATPALRTTRGSIVFITCSSATTPFKNHLPYVVAKGALKQLMRTLALELAPDVRVNAVAPGTVLPPEAFSDEVTQRLVARIPLQRTGTAQDVAEAVRYLASASFVTGHEIAVDGGRSLAAVERFS